MDTSRGDHTRAGLAYDPPRSALARSDLAAALRWTGHDLDVPRAGWPNAPEPLGGLLGGPPALAWPSARDTEAWLDRLYARYFKDWLADDGVDIVEDATIELTQRFGGFGWGIVARFSDCWARRLGPGGCAALLLRVPSDSQLRLLFQGVHAPDAPIEDLAIFVNGVALATQLISREPGASLSVAVDLDTPSVATDGRLFVLLRERPDAWQRRRGETGFAIRSIEIARRTRPLWSPQVDRH